VELCTELFYAVVPTLFILVNVTFLAADACLSSVKFAIYYRAASLPSQVSYAVLAEESQAFFKHSPHTNSISNSAILRNNYISLLSDLCACVGLHVNKKWRRKGSHSSSESGSNRLMQEHIEPAKPGREHVTTIDSEIQTWLPDTILVTSKYGKAATCACIAAFLESPDTVQE